MNEQEKQASLFYMDLKKLISGKFIRTIEYEFSNERERIKTRTDISLTSKDMMYINLLVMESNIKKELKSITELE